MTTDKNGVFYFWDILSHKVVANYHIYGDTQKDDLGPITKTIENLESNKSSPQQTKRGDVSLLDSMRTGKNPKEKGWSDRSKTNLKFKRTAKDFVSDDGIVHYLLDITEISYIKLLAISSTDKNIRIWEVSDVGKARIIFCLNLVKGGVHQVKYFNSFQVLLVAGYENSIPVFSITPKYFDLNIVGRLVGHVSIITAIDIIEGTPMVITADDTGCIKTWDVRLCQCFQSIEMSNKTIISQLLSLDNLFKIAFIGFRVNFLSFDKWQKSYKEDGKLMMPVRAEVNLVGEELVVCTNSDVRFLDMNTGRMKKIYSHLISEEMSEDITVFRILNKGSRFLLADQSGGMYIFNYSNGEKLMKIQSHTLEVVDVKIDNYNKLIVSGGADSQIIIQKEIVKEEKEAGGIELKEEEIVESLKMIDKDQMLKKIRKNHRDELRKIKVDTGYKELEKKLENTGPKAKVLRRIVNTHQNKEISILAVSVYHNLIASVASDNIVYLYEYEFGKYLKSIKVNEGQIVTALEFINGLGIILLCTNDGICYLIEVGGRDNRHQFNVSAYINLNIRSEVLKMKSQRTKMEMDSSQKVGQRPGSIVLADSLPKKKEFTQIPQKKTSLNSKPDIISLQEIGEKIAFGQKILVSMSLKGKVKDLEDLKKNPNIDSEDISLNMCEVYFTLNDGYISIYDFTSVLKDMKIVKHANTRLNYNPLRMNNEDCSSVTSEPRGQLVLDPSNLRSTPCFDNSMVCNFFGHKDGVTSISIIKVPQEYLLTTGNDRYVKIITKTGDCVCAWNVNHPLPLKWDLPFDNLQDSKNKILYGLKVIQSIFKKYYDKLYVEGKIFDLKGFIKQYKEIDDDGKYEEIFQLTSVQTDNSKIDKRVMADEYQGKDFATGKMKELYKTELIGPTLKQLEAKRKLILAQEQSKQDDTRLKVNNRRSSETLNQARLTYVPMYFDGLKDSDTDKIERPKRGELVTNVMNDFKKVEDVIKKKGVSAKDKEKVWSDLMDDIRKKEEKKEVNSKGIPFPSLNTTMKKSESNNKINFLDYAKKQNLIGEDSLYGKKSLVVQKYPTKNIIGDQETTAHEDSEPRNYSSDGRIKRQQKANRESNKEKLSFHKAVTTLNTTLRQNQNFNPERRNPSLPSLHTRLIEINSILDTKITKPKGGKYTSNMISNKSKSKASTILVPSKRNSYNLFSFH